MFADYTGACDGYVDNCDPNDPYIADSCCTCPKTDANQKCPALPKDPDGCGSSGNQCARDYHGVVLSKICDMFCCHCHAQRALLSFCCY